MSGSMAGLPPFGMGTDKDRRVTVCFRIPYMTRWGQSLVLMGGGGAFGVWGWPAGMGVLARLCMGHKRSAAHGRMGHER
jgi:hypothetical protein